jgi:hypothetical protein
MGIDKMSPRRSLPSSRLWIGDRQLRNHPPALRILANASAHKGLTDPPRSLSSGGGAKAPGDGAAESTGSPPSLIPGDAAPSRSP